MAKSSLQTKAKVSAKTIKQELDDYDLFALEEDMDFAMFWRTHQVYFPKLSFVVKSICCGPPATVASESDFSMGSDFVWAKRN